MARLARRDAHDDTRANAAISQHDRARARGGDRAIEPDTLRGVDVVQRADGRDRRREHHHDERRHDRTQSDHGRRRELDEAHLAPHHARGHQPRALGAPAVAVALDELPRRHCSRGEGEQSERNEHHDRRAQCLADRVPLLAPRRLQIFAERADRRREIAPGIEARLEVDAAHRIGGEVAVRLVERARVHPEPEHARLVGHGLGGERPDADDREGRGGRALSVGGLEREGDALPDPQTFGIGNRRVDERLVGRVGAGKPARAHFRQLDGEAITGRRDQRTRVRGIDAGGVAEVAGIHALLGDAGDRTQRRFGLRRRQRPVADRRVGRVGRDEDPVVRGRSAPGGRQARETQPEPQPEQDTRGHEGTTVAGQPRPHDKEDRPHGSTLGRGGTLRESAPRSDELEVAVQLPLGDGRRVGVAPTGVEHQPFPPAAVQPVVDERRRRAPRPAACRARARRRRC